ncbi:hypothetical protein PENANT_c034G10965, partial [Penicillium antarcticum]
FYFAYLTKPETLRGTIQSTPLVFWKAYKA